MIRPPASQPPLLVLEHVEKFWRRGSPEAPLCAAGLIDVSLRLHRRETVMLEAAPGAGGTTLLLVAAGLARADGGAVSRGRSGDADSGSALVPTLPAFPACWTPTDVVHEAIARSRDARDSASIAQRELLGALLRVGLTERACGQRLGALPAIARWQSALAAARVSGAAVLLVDRPPQAPEVDADPELALLAWCAAFMRPTGCAPASNARAAVAEPVRLAHGWLPHAVSSCDGPSVLVITRLGYPTVPGMRRLRLVSGRLLERPVPRWSVESPVRAS